MAEQGQEQDKSEEATPFKLDHARRKGQVARGMDLGFLSVLVGLAIVSQLSGSQAIERLALMMRRSFAQLIPAATDTGGLGGAIENEIRAIAAMLVVPVSIVVVLVVVMEIVQIRGIVFSSAPLKPDFSRLNPAKGLFKFGLYCGGAFLLIRQVSSDLALQASDGRQLAGVLAGAAGKLLLLFIVLAALTALIDQLLSRREFAKQMRMSRREVTREQREREGEPRQKQKRRQMLDEILQQAGAAANLQGADVLIVNPTHYAVALSYRPGEADAPVIRARGRNAYAQRMRKEARRFGIAIVRNPRLARALYREGRIGSQIGQAHFVAVADIYIMLRRTARHEAREE